MLGFWVQGQVLRVGLRIKDSGFRIQGSGFRIQVFKGSGFSVQRIHISVYVRTRGVLRFRVQDSYKRVPQGF
jgi:hypothetical protein